MIEINPLRKRKLYASDLKLGMYVCELDRPWNETPFLFQGFPLLTVEELQAVQACCSFVFIDELRRVTVNLDRPGNPATEPLRHNRPVAPAAEPARQVRRPPVATPKLRRAPRPVQQIKREALSVEVQNARASHRKTSAVVKDLFLAIKLGRGIDVGDCRTVVRNNLESLLRNESALLWLSRMKRQDDYTSQHCLAVSVMAMGFGRYLGVDRIGLEQLGLAGLLHDVGKIKIDPQILNKPGKLTAEEFAQMQAHAEIGYQLLAENRDLPPMVLDVTRDHHERLDGRGYPRRLGAVQIADYTRLISIIDCFDAITSPRVYDQARSVKDAFKVLMDSRETQYDAELVLQFIEWLGIFPVGTLVELHTGEIGLVVEKNPELKLRPKVVVLIDQDGQRCPPRFLDLAKVCVDAESNPYRITRGLPDGTRGLNMIDPEVQALLDNRELQDMDDPVGTSSPQPS
ncbi:HD-GYP domain-containing protein [Pseudomonas sp. N040]|uniref:HD-GYP domain-containing protein n=1 Tax=Pseudomonas sp. N040 TaxID=2785325 RepID=UPI0018A2F0A8|nr:HD-GYP domain-containing protein [Pseudomonas sp. N040]MBF7730014.1 HD-GYP domain-containing protein [Pseudomonas sp. N040]MBW7013656.1 HD-GYP domain-containing protein [Pseudomonas sp. N040]